MDKVSLVFTIKPVEIAMNNIINEESQITFILTKEAVGKMTIHGCEIVNVERLLSSQIMTR